MTKKKKVEDSELEKVNGGAGIMDDPASEKFASVGSNPGNSEFDSHNHDLGNDMILTETDRE